MNLDDIKKALLDGGVVGAGGAGFPTYADSFWLNIQMKFVLECRC